MKQRATLLLLIAVAYGINGQNCQFINANGDFEITTYIPGSENSQGISYGTIDNWHATHGTSDYFDHHWNWYDLVNLESNIGHICYGNRPTHDHSEGMYTEAVFKSDESVSYNISFDFSSYCDSDKFGKVHIYLANNLQPGGSNGFYFPTPERYPEWFDRTQLVDIITLDETTSHEAFGMQHYQRNIKPDGDYSQLWFFTEYMHEYTGFVNCGLLMDNVMVECQTENLKNIVFEAMGQNMYALKGLFLDEEDDLAYTWNFGDGTYSDKSDPMHVFENGIYDVCLDITNTEGCCGQLCKQLVVGNFETKDVCDYDICLDMAGEPTIEEIRVTSWTGEAYTLNSGSEYFHFPYCLAYWSHCQRDVLELDILVDDLNAWFKREGLDGRIQEGEDTGSVYNGCRGNVLSVSKSEMTFDYIMIRDMSQHGSEEAVPYEFYYKNCSQKIFIPESDRSARDSGESSGMVKVFPNPAEDYIHVMTKSVKEENVTHQLLDSGGNILFSSNSNNPMGDNGNRFEMSGIKPGVYFLRSLLGQNIEVQKIVKI